MRWVASARAHVHTAFPDIANGWADCVQMWFVARHPLDKSFTQVRSDVQLHVRMWTPLFHISQTDGRIAFKFGAWLGTLAGTLKSEVGCICTCARADAFRTMMPSRPLVYRRSRRLTSLIVQISVIRWPLHNTFRYFTTQFMELHNALSRW